MLSKEFDLYLKGIPRSALILCNDIEGGVKSAFEVASMILNDNVTEQDSHPDLMYVNETKIKRDVVDSVIEFSKELPVTGKRSVVIIKDAHLINISTQEILLKTLEENTTCIILFVSSKPLIPTIMSRIAVIHVKDIGNKYEVENVKVLFLQKRYKELFALFGLLREKDPKAISDKKYFVEIVNALRTCAFEMLMLITEGKEIKYCDNVVMRNYDECFDILYKCEQILEKPFTENNVFGFLMNCCI